MSHFAATDPPPQGPGLFTGADVLQPHQSQNFLSESCSLVAKSDSQSFSQSFSQGLRPVSQNHQTNATPHWNEDSTDSYSAKQLLRLCTIAQCLSQFPSSFKISRLWADSRRVSESLSRTFLQPDACVYDLKLLKWRCPGNKAMMQSVLLLFFKQYSKHAKPMSACGHLLYSCVGTRRLLSTTSCC